MGSLRILIDVLHPAHVHFFRNFYREMCARGHEVLFTARSKEFTTRLLDHYDLPYRLISVQRHGTLGLAAELAVRTYRLIRIARVFRPSVLTGIMGPSIALAGRVCRVPAVVFYDTEFAKQTNRFVYPLAHCVCTPDCYTEEVRGEHVTYAGYHELAYLHPRRFRPDRARLASFGLREDEPYSLVRFVSWQAAHDVRERGLTPARKRSLIRLLERYGRVVISSEGPLPEDLESRRLRGPVQDVHHLIAFARILVGESATMASEAAVLGVPAVFIATTSRGYMEEQEHRYGSVRHFHDSRTSDAMEVVEAILEGRDPVDFAAARGRLLEEKIDVTEWMVRFFETNFGSRSPDGSAARAAMSARTL